MGMDTPERRRAEAALKEANEALERQVAERTAALRESEERLGLFVDGTKDCALFMLDPNGHITTWNEGARRLKGYESNEIVGQHFSVLYTPADVAAGRPARELGVARSKGRHEEEGDRVCKDGSRFRASVLITALRDEQGRLRGFSNLTRDITERKQVEELLARSRDRFNGIISAAMDAIITTDSQQRIVLFNPAAEKMFGVSAGETVGESINRFIPARFREGHVSHVEHFAKTGVTSRRMGGLSAISGLRANGEEFPIEASISQVEVHGERLFTVILRDITERRRVEEALRQSEQRLRLFFDSAPAAIAIFDARMCYLAASKRWQQDYKLSGDLTGLSHYSVFPEIGEQWKQVHNRCLGGAAERSEEDRFVRADGTVAWLKWEVLPWRGSSNEIDGIIILSEDITQRKQAEEVLRVSEDRFRAYVEQAADAMFVHDFSGRIIEVNRQACVSLGYRREELLSLGILDVETDFDLAQAQAAWRQLNPGQPSSRRGNHRRKDGSTFPVEVRFGCFDLKGERCYLAMVRDITEGKRAEEELRTSREQLRALAARIGTKKQKILQDKVGALMNLTDLASQSVRRIASELRPVVLDSLGMCAAIEWVAGDFQRRTRVHCEASVPSQDLAIDRNSSTALFRILQESLTNVARHAQATKVEIHLWREADEIILTVADNGRGVQPSELKDPHSMGLLGMRERASLLTGRCEIRPQAGGGTTVEVRIPIASIGKPDAKLWSES